VGPEFYSLGMILLYSVTAHEITQKSVSLLFLRSLISNEENQ
jgi:hypothetical protein